MIRSAIAFGVAATVTGGAASAATLLEYQAARSDTNPTLSPSVEAPGLTGAPMSAGTGITANSGGSGGTWAWRDYDQDNTSAALAIADDEIWLWGFTALPGREFDLTTFDIALNRTGGGPDDFELDLSVNGGPFEQVLSFDFMDDNTRQDFVAVDLSAFTGVRSAVFRLAAFNNEAADPGSQFQLDTVDDGGQDPRSFRLDGELTRVPLPAAMPLLLVGLAGLGLVARRRG